MGNQVHVRGRRRRHRRHEPARPRPTVEQERRHLRQDPARLDRRSGSSRRQPRPRHKDRDGRGRYALGAAHKLNGLNGAAYLLDSQPSPVRIGLTGQSTVKLAKDPPGQLRRHGLHSSGGLHWFGDLVLDSQHETFIVATVEAPYERADNFRPTHNMAKVAKILTDVTQPLSENGVVIRVGGNAVNARQALAFLVDDGFVHREVGPNNAKLHRLVKPYP